MVQPAVRTIISSEDVWQGKTSPAERRKIQNRLNQRAWRQRRKLEKLRQGTARGAKSSSTAESALVVARKDSSTSSSSSPSNEDATTDAAEDTATYMYDTAMELAHPGPKRRRANGERMYAKHATLMALTYIGRRRRLFELQDEDMDELYGIFLMKAMHSGSDPMADSLLPLVQFNLFRGLMENMKTLGLSLGMMCDEECDSPIGTDPRFHSQTVWDIPVYLRPTETQLSVVHHPWLDVLPLPRMRDNLIKMDGKYDDEELCLDMVGDGNAPSGKGEMILWGEPWDPMNWEVTDVFVNKWRSDAMERIDLYRLPNELIYCIMQSAGENRDCKLMRNLCLTSRRIYPFARVELYRNLKIPTMKAYGLLTRSLIENPALRRFIRIVDITISGSRYMADYSFLFRSWADHKYNDKNLAEAERNLLLLCKTSCNKSASDNARCVLSLFLLLLDRAEDVSLDLNAFSRPATRLLAAGLEMSRSTSPKALFPSLKRLRLTGDAMPNGAPEGVEVLTDKGAGAVLLPPDACVTGCEGVDDELTEPPLLGTSTETEIVVLLLLASVTLSAGKLKRDDVPRVEPDEEMG
ncbi:hypothetical protein CkaCkLH20_09250 [Colletotrichum karsti]|uniref:BZIP domain-containing protein n=1 Tax=Colletotrichum karsti TaxID=1095194 RepID=A0A9P6LIB7_9PEZI|nr:uncharacterized protein CkaCkLH20_09250 [Colletotrichum karsti]KAF9873437.1 hypothetical protein CkaCkLH20_09250 [Colletotrichum karsti]